MGLGSNPVLFIDPADNGLPSLGKAAGRERRRRRGRAIDERQRRAQENSPVEKKKGEEGRMFQG